MVVIHTTLEAIVHISVIHPYASSEGETPQRTHSGIESDDDHLNPRKRKASFSGGANKAKAGNSLAIGTSSPHPSTKKGKLT